MCVCVCVWVGGCVGWCVGVCVGAQTVLFVLYVFVIRCMTPACLPHRGALVCFDVHGCVCVYMLHMRPTACVCVRSCICARVRGSSACCDRSVGILMLVCVSATLIGPLSSETA